MVERLLAMKNAVDEILENPSVAPAPASMGPRMPSQTASRNPSSRHQCRQNARIELIAKFIDSKLKSSNKGSSEEELEMILDKALTLFRYIVGKDVFEGFYKRELPSVSCTARARASTPRRA